MDHLDGEFKKIKPSTFDGESRIDEDAEAWLLDIKKYFHIYIYSSNMNVIMTIYNLKGKSIVWWHDLKLSKYLTENKIECTDFKKETILFLNLLWEKSQRVLWTKVRKYVYGRSNYQIYGTIEVYALYQGKKSKIS